MNLKNPSCAGVEARKQGDPSCRDALGTGPFDILLVRTGHLTSSRFADFVYVSKEINWKST